MITFTNHTNSFTINDNGTEIELGKNTCTLLKSNNRIEIYFHNGLKIERDYTEISPLQPDAATAYSYIKTFLYS